MPEQGPALAFYFDALGCALDPRRAGNVEKGKGTMWANIGLSQFHLPVGDAEVVDGHMGLRCAATMLERAVLERQVRGALEATHPQKSELDRALAR